MIKTVFLIISACFATHISTAQTSVSPWFRKNIVMPFLFADPTEKYASVSIGALAKDNKLKYPYYSPLGIAVAKSLLANTKNELSIDASCLFQFGFREENNIYFSGWRKTYLNADYRLQGNYTRTLSDKVFARFTLMHRSSHLGDDYILLNGIKNTGYWKNDPSAYEQVFLTIFYKNKFLNAYVKPGYIVRKDTPRKKLELQAGFFLSQLTQRSFYKNFILGMDVRMLESNSYVPGVNSKLGYYFAPGIHVALVNYFGPIPYSRLESLMQINWTGIGIYFEPVF